MDRRERARGLLQTKMTIVTWLQVPLFIGLVAALLLLVVSFFHALVEAVLSGAVLDRNQAILLVLDLLDMVFIANLIAIAMVSGYKTYFGTRPAEMREDGETGPGERASGVLAETETDAGLSLNAMKSRIATVLVVISGIHLLHEILAEETEDWQTLVGLASVHLALLATALVLLWVARNER